MGLGGLTIDRQFAEWELGVLQGRCRARQPNAWFKIEMQSL